MIIDAQVHAYAMHSAQWPWADPEWRMDPPEATGEQNVALMDGAGVDGTILVSTWQTYRNGTGYAESVYRAYPDRFRLVRPVDPAADPVTRVEEWAATPGAVGVRLLYMPRTPYGGEHPGVAAVVKTAAAAGLAVNVHCWGRLSVINELARAFPDAQFVLDHLGMAQRNDPPAPDGALADLGQVLSLARHPNIAVKLTGACAYSRQPFPYKDLWEPMGLVLDAFGVERCMWGTDWQRLTRVVSYGQAVTAFRDHWPLSPADRATLMGGSAQRIYNWSAH